jgi:DNA-binding transcriptional MocR family regulator
VNAPVQCEQAAAEGISLAPGPLFSATGRYPNCVRLNAALPWTPALEAALRRIGRLARLQLDR